MADWFTVPVPFHSVRDLEAEEKSTSATFSALSDRRRRRPKPKKTVPAKFAALADGDPDYDPLNDARLSAADKVEAEFGDDPVYPPDVDTETKMRAELGTFSLLETDPDYDPLHDSRLSATEKIEAEFG